MVAQVVHDQALAPLATVRTRLLGTIADTGVQQQIVNWVLADLGEGLLGEGLDVAQVVELEGQDGDGVGGAVEG